MYESGWYPPGAEYDPNAPWNEPVIPDQEFEVTISQTLSKTVTVTTQDYNPVFDDEIGMYADTSDTHWHDVYEKQHYKIQDLLKALVNYVTEDLKNPELDSVKKNLLKGILEDCEGWIEDECEINEA